MVYVSASGAIGIAEEEEAGRLVDELDAPRMTLRYWF